MFKNILVVLSVIFSLSSVAYSDHDYYNAENFVGNFPAQTEVYMDRTYGNVIVHNWNQTPIVCDGKVVGLTYSGAKAFSYARGLVLYPGQYASLYVYTNNFNPFRWVRPNINCRFLYW